MKKKKKKKNRKIVIPVAEVPKPLPRTVEEAWDAMKATNELPAGINKPYLHPKLPPFKVNDGYTSTLILQERTARRKECTHRRANGDLNIKWMEHSQHLTLGVCGQCVSQFDTRNPADAVLLAEDTKSQRNMGRAGAHAQRLPSPVVFVPTSLWQQIKTFFQNLFNRPEEEGFVSGVNRFGQKCLVPKQLVR